MAPASRTAGIAIPERVDAGISRLEPNGSILDFLFVIGPNGQSSRQEDEKVGSCPQPLLTAIV